MRARRSWVLLFAATLFAGVPAALAQDGDAAASSDDGDEAAATTATTEGAAEPAPAPERSGGVLGELEALMDDLVRARSRAAMVSAEVFSTRVEIRLEGRMSRPVALDDVEVRIDGVLAHRAETAPGRDEATVFEGHVAPGVHRIEVRARAHAVDDETVTTEQVAIVRAPLRRGGVTVVTVALEGTADVDDGMAEADRARVELRTRFRFRFRPNEPDTEDEEDE